MSTTLQEKVDGADSEGAAENGDRVVKVTRRRIDYLLLWLGLAVTAVLVIAGVLLQWGSNFSEDYVSDELSAQNITFPPEEALLEDNPDLAKYGGELVDTGKEAEAYATYIQGHIDAASGGLAYAEIPDRAARAAVTEAIESGASDEEIAELQATADELTTQRDTVFRGTMLRGALLNTYAWSVIGRIAGIASIFAFIGAGVMLVLVIAGVVHLRRLH